MKISKALKSNIDEITGYSVVAWETINDYLIGKYDLSTMKVILRGNYYVKTINSIIKEIKRFGY